MRWVTHRLEKKVSLRQPAVLLLLFHFNYGAMGYYKTHEAAPPATSPTLMRFSAVPLMSRLMCCASSPRPKDSGS